MSRAALFLSFVLLLFGAGQAFAVNVNWNERARRFTQYVEKNARDQGRRSTSLGKNCEDFQRRDQRYVRELGKHVLVVKDNSAQQK